MTQLNLQNELAVITGASAGLGEEYAKQLARRGAKLLLVARREDRLKALCESIKASCGCDAQYRVVDLARPATDPEFQALLAELRQKEVGLLVNNAGFGSFGRFDALDIENEIAMTRLNIEATLRIAHAVIPKMKARRFGGILSISSVAAFQALPFMATYAGTKGFNLMHSTALRYELAEFGIRVVTVCPGPTATEFRSVARVPGMAGNSFRDDPVKVVAESIRALDRNAPFVVTGMQNKLQKLLITLLPRRLTTWVVGRTLKNS